MNNKDMYILSMFYESFIRNAHNDILRSRRLGADQSFMSNLMCTEIGDSSHAGLKLKSYDIQLEKVKQFMSKAINKYLKWALTKDEKALFLQMQEDLVAAKTTASLMRIVQDGLDLTQRFRGHNGPEQNS